MLNLADVSGYPLDNSFMIFTKSSDVPKGIDEVLEHIASSSTGMKIIDLIASISQRLRKTLATGSQEDPLSLGDNSDLEMLDEEGGESGDEDDIDEFDDGFLSDGDGLESFGPPGSIRPSSLSTYNIPAEAAVKINRRIRADFRAVKFAGFKLGVLSGLKAESQTSVISISIQAAKLGLSDEALQAWDLGPQQYIVLLMRYADGYKTFEAVVSEPAKSLEISFRIGVGNKYKPTLNEAHSAFTEITKHETSSHNGNNATSSDDKAMTGFSSLFISSSLNEFFNEQFISLLKIRSSMGLGWDGAKLFFNDNQGRFDQEASILGPQYYEESTPAQGSLPEMLCGDHLTDTNSTSVSFPLITAQFAMRYLLRCTEYCLVCHDKISGEFEALKPYVCDKPLCLYQYMSLGFGPSVEHEIMTQPVVVDLLVSFCYAAASVGYVSFKGYVS
jgi:ubiquitin-conjugating enzyme E2 Q